MRGDRIAGERVKVLGIEASAVIGAAWKGADKSARGNDGDDNDECSVRTTLLFCHGRIFDNDGSKKEG